jgi:hypothetical protein
VRSKPTMRANIALWSVRRPPRSRQATGWHNRFSGWCVSAMRRHSMPGWVMRPPVTSPRLPTLWFWLRSRDRFALVPIFSPRILHGSDHESFVITEPEPEPVFGVQITGVLESFEDLWLLYTDILSYIVNHPRL